MDIRGSWLPPLLAALQYHELNIQSFILDAQLHILLLEFVNLLLAELVVHFQVLDFLFALESGSFCGCAVPKLAAHEHEFALGHPRRARR